MLIKLPFSLATTTAVIVVLLAFLDLLIVESKIVNPEGYFPYPNVSAAAAPQPLQSAAYYGYRFSKSEIEHCNISLQMALVQDVTASYKLDIDILKDEIAGAYDDLTLNYPGSELALSLFTDKSVSPLGFDLPEWRDFCYTVWSEFGRTKRDFLYKLGSLSAGGGYDWAEAQVDAMLRAALNKRINWNEDKLHRSTGFPIVKVIVLATNSGFHLANNLSEAIEAHNANPGSGVLPPARPNTLLEHPETLDADVNAECATMEYPTAKQLGDALRREKIVPVFLLSPSVYDCDGELCTYPELEEMASWGGDDYLDGSKGMEALYTQLAKDMGVAAVIGNLGLSYKDLRKMINAAAEELHGFSCEGTPSPSIINPTTKTTAQTTTTDSQSTAEGETGTKGVVVPPIGTICNETCVSDCEVKVDVKVNVSVGR